MSLSAALSTATSGLSSLQTQSAILSGNVSNAQNADYSRRYATLTTQAVNGLPMAGRVSSILRVSDSMLSQSYYSSVSGLGLADAQLANMNKLAGLLGASESSSEQTALGQALSQFEQAWKNLEATPESADLKAQVINRGKQMLSEIARLAAQENSLRLASQDSIQSGLTGINDAAARIASLNSQIVAQQNAGQSVADLQDLRDAELAKIAAQTDIKVLVDDRGAMSVYSANGVQIVAGTQAQTFRYDADSNTILNAGPGNGGSDVTAGLAGGALQGQLDFLDTSAAALASSDPNRAGLAKMMNQLDALAQNIMDVVNAAYDDPDTADAEVFFEVDPTAPADARIASSLIVAATADDLLTGRAGAVQQAMATTQITADASNPASAPNGLRLGSTTLSGLVSGILSYHARAASEATTDQAAASSLKSTVEIKLQDTKGVDIDTELAQLQLLQNNYAALANVLNSIISMYDELMSIGR